VKTDFIIDLLHHIKNLKFLLPANPTVEDFRMWMNDKKYPEESPTKLFKKENHQVFIYRK